MGCRFESYLASTEPKQSLVQYHEPNLFWFMNMARVNSPVFALQHIVFSSLRGLISRMIFHFVYILISDKDKSLYIGISNNVFRRLTEHNAGKSTYTSRKRPYRLIYYEAFANSQDAYRREGYFKTTKGKKALKLMLRKTLTMNDYRYI